MQKTFKKHTDCFRQAEWWDRVKSLIASDLIFEWF